MVEKDLLAGKRCLLTGATAGIGEAAASELAAMGAELIIVGRNEEKCKRVLEKIKAKHPTGAGNYLVADLSNREEVLRLAKEFRNQYDSLDILINNAGAIFFEDIKSSDGIEMTWALNHFGYFWLTLELLDCLKNAPSARIINVSSAAHQRGRLSENIVDEHNSFGYATYANTKLANVLFTKELSSRLAQDNITVNALHPGIVSTNFAKNKGILGQLLVMASSIFAISPEEGARTMIYLASDPKVQTESGKYFVKEKEKQTSSAARSAELASRVWDASEKLTAEIDERRAN